MFLKQQAASNIIFTERDLLSLHKKKVSLKKMVKFGANVPKWGNFKCMGGGRHMLLKMSELQINLRYMINNCEKKTLDKIKIQLYRLQKHVDFLTTDNATKNLPNMFLPTL